MPATTILVTGGAGFIGSAVCRHLIATTDHRVVNLDKLTYAANLASLAAVQNDPRYRFVEGDIGDSVLLRHLLAEEEVGIIMHLAAESHVDRSIDGPAAFIETNVVGTLALLDEDSFETLCRDPDALPRLGRPTTLDSIALSPYAVAQVTTSA